MKKIGIIFAMNKELELFASIVSYFTKEKGNGRYGFLLDVTD